jgi:hypothetical protein
MGGSSSKGGGDPVDSIVRSANRDQLMRAVRDLPFPKGHHILREFADALEGEYVMDRGPLVGQFLEQMDMSALRSAGVDIGDFVEWTQWIEALVRVSYHGGKNYTSISQLRSEWGLAQAAAPSSYSCGSPMAAPVYATAYPSTVSSPPGGDAQYATAQGTPVAVAHPVCAPVATAVASPVATPCGYSPPVAQPVTRAGF